MSTTTVRMDDDLKAEVNAILDSMGLNFNTFVNMASVQLVSQRRIPFEWRLNPCCLARDMLPPMELRTVGSTNRDIRWSKCRTPWC